jgi:hypothetical protein
MTAGPRSPLDQTLVGQSLEAQTPWDQSPADRRNRLANRTLPALRRNRPEERSHLGVRAAAPHSLRGEAHRAVHSHPRTRLARVASGQHTGNQQGVLRMSHVVVGSSRLGARDGAQPRL